MHSSCCHAVSQAKPPPRRRTAQMSHGRGAQHGRGHTPSGLVSTYVGRLFIVVDVVNVPSQAKVCNLHHVVLRHQDVPGS